MIIQNQNALSYASKFAPSIEKICRPLQDYFGISNFGYLKIFFNHRYFYICNDHRLIKDIISTQEDSMIFGERKLFLPKASNEFTHMPWPSASSHYGMDLYLKYNYWNGLTFAKVDTKYVELWWFAADSNNINIKSFYYRNINTLEKFIYYFQAKTKSMFDLEAKGTLPTFIKGVDFSSINRVPDIDEDKKINEFLSDIKLSCIDVKALTGHVKLSSQEIKCLHLLSIGKTAKEIGIQLNISNRTAEYYLARVKIKTGYSFKSNLIDLYNSQLTKYF